MKSMLTLSLQAETVDELLAKLVSLSALFGARLNTVPTPAAVLPTVISAPADPNSTVTVTSDVPTSPTVVTMPNNIPSSLTQAVQNAQAVQTAPVSPLPTAPAPTYDAQTLAFACGTLMDMPGGEKAVQDLMEKYGVKNSGLFALPPEQYGAFAADLRAKGVTV